MSVKTQGTHLYVVDSSTSSDPSLIKFSCPTGITGLGGPADQIDDTCLDATEDRSFVRGLGNPGQVSVPFVLKPENASHQTLFDLKEGGDNLPWIVCLSDGVAAPTLNDGQIVPPVDRTSFEFIAYISDINIDIATNEVVRGTLTLQRSGRVTTHWKEPA